MKHRSLFATACKSLPGLLAALAAATSATGQTPLLDHRGGAADELGQALVTVGDVDGDGFDDYAIGAPHAAGLQADAGSVALYSGGSGAVLWTYQGWSTGDLLGWSLDLIGDVDGDLIGDLVVGVPGFDAGAAFPDAGAVLVLSGATAGWIQGWQGPDAGARMGLAVAGPGDVDGDGVGDYAFGAPNYSGISVDGGLVLVYSGATHAWLRIYDTEQAGSLFGYSLDAAGDVNGDGLADLLAGAPRWSPPGVPGGLDYGKAYALDGAVDHGVLYGVVGSGPGALLGTAVAGGHDLSGDGRPDAVFGAPGALLGASAAGRVSVWSGGPNHPLLFDLFGTAAGDEFGAAVDVIDDTDGDGVADVLVGAPGADPGLPPVPEAGVAQLHGGASGVLLYRINGYQPGDRMGTTVAGLGHVNADPLGDFGAGAPRSDHPVLGADTGWVRTCLGGTPAPLPYCTAKVNSAGCTPRISYTSSASVSVGDAFHLVAVNVLENKPGILIWSYQQQATPFYGGTLCVKPPIVRTPAQTSFFNPGWPCTGAYDFHLSHAYMASKGIAAGQVLHFQWWSRDSGFAPPNSIGLTDALMVTILP